MSDPHDEAFDGLAALYAAGALSDDERTAFETHLEVCLECVTEVKSLLPVTHRLLHCALSLEPPTALRARVLSEVAGWTPAPAEDTPFATLDTTQRPTPVTQSRKRGPGGLFWLAASLLIAGAAAGGWYVAELNGEVESLQGALDTATLQTEILELEVAAANLEAAERDAVLAVVTSPDVQQLAMAGQPLAPRASARALWNDTARLVFLANGLPALPAGDIYQLWFVLPDAPVSAALVEPDPTGNATVTLDVPDTVTMPTTMAITIEPAGGVPAPTGDIYLLGQPSD